MIGKPYKAPSNGRDATCGGKIQPLGLYAIKSTREVSYDVFSTSLPMQAIDLKGKAGALEIV
jgi:hypothetical protein